MKTYSASHYSTSLQLLAAYDGTVPLSSYLKNYFSQHKKYGSKDRKTITHFCYSYYRLGLALHELSLPERLLVALFLCNDKEGDWLSLYDNEWQENFSPDLTKRIAFVQTKHSFFISDMLYKDEQLSEGIHPDAFARSHLIQPDLFLRIRPGKKLSVINQLQQSAIDYKEINKSCIAVNNSIKLDDVLQLNKEVVVQDYSSQQVAELFKNINLPDHFSVWDCCAASGGKSILTIDYFKHIQLSVSDVRSSILHNLRKRFQQAGINHYTSFVADMADGKFLIKKQFDFIICDAPCSGSGTWSRTPEQLYFFTNKKLSHYVQLQKKITANIGKYVKQNGYLLYITCSVFVQENEEIVKHIQQTSKMKLITAEVIKGYDMKADTMFSALFSKED